MSTNFKTLTAISALLALTACGGSDGNSVTENLENSFDAAYEFYDNNVNEDGDGNHIYVDPSDIQKTSASYSGYMTIQTVNDEFTETPQGNENYDEGVHLEYAIGTTKLDATFENGSANIEGSADNFEYIMVEHITTRDSNGEEISSMTIEENLASLDGSVDVDGAISGTDGSLINVAGSLSGVVDGQTFEASASDTITANFIEDNDGNEMFYANGTLEISGFQDIDDNTTIFAVAD